MGGGGALQRGHSASLEPLAQRNEALSVGNELVIIVVVPTNTVATEPGGSKHNSAAVQQCQWALTQRQTLWGGGALERGHSAPLERLANLSDALGGVGAGPPESDATERVVSQAAKGMRYNVNGR